MAFEHRENSPVTLAISLNAVAPQFDALHWNDFRTRVEKQPNCIDVSTANSRKQGSKSSFFSVVHVRASIN
jgi:hypothetical protein